MSTYFDILTRVRTVLAGLAATGGAEVKIRPEVAFLKDQGDTLPLVIVAPRRDRWEQVADLFFDGSNSIQGGVRLDHAVVVAAVIESRFDQAQLRWQFDFREAARKALWDARAVSSTVTTVTDVEYDPAPRGVDLSALVPSLDVSVQQFTYRSDEARYVP